MLTSIKNGLEKLSGNRLWIGWSSDPGKVRALIHSLCPVDCCYPLVRIGTTGDGGYLLPDDLDNISACVSPGISVEVGFDLAMADRGIDVFMADASVAGPPVYNPHFYFTPKFLDVLEDETHTRLDSLCAQIVGGGDRILQMDIEGAEYRVLLDTSDECLRRFRIMVIEFHDLHQLFGRFSFGLIEATFRKLLRFHRVVHIHPNNVSQPIVRNGIAIPPVMEFTFLRRDRTGSCSERQLTFPHLLDRDNASDCLPVILPECWRT